MMQHVCNAAAGIPNGCPPLVELFSAISCLSLSAYICIMNYFELFGLPVSPVVSKTSLSAKYFELQKQSHPDFYTQATEIEQDDSLKRSADINKAFTIFRDEQRTIEYFLQTTGMIIENEKYNLPPDFLMEMMEINEAIAEEDASAVAKKLAEYEASLYGVVKPVIENYDKLNSSQADLLKLKEYYYKKKYLNRILDRLGD
ncbi:MAG: iron-sulfur cluster co-chaperone HscB C-terminal domain-containing protein [Ferruginibacter sp.]